MELEIKQNWQKVLDDSITKTIGKEKSELLPLFYKFEGCVTQEITEVIRHFLLSNTTLGSFSLSSLFCFSERYDKPVKLFQIFYNDALKTNEAVWRVGDIEFCEFRECLIYYLVNLFCTKRSLNIKRQIKSAYKISDNELKKIIDDEDVLTFIRKLNQVKFFEIRNWLSGVRSGIDGTQTLLERDIGELLFLMQENQEILEPYLEGSAFAKFFPDKSRNTDSLQSILKSQVTSLISIYTLRFTLKNIINEEIGKNNNIDCFTENNGKFYRVLRFTESSKDAALHDKHQNVKLDVESSSDYWFEQLWIVKDVKEKIYFPEVNAETVFRKSCERFNSYLTRNVEYLDENLGKEVLLKDAKLWVCKKSLLEFFEKNLELKKDEQLGQNLASNNLQESRLEPDEVALELECIQDDLNHSVLKIFDYRIGKEPVFVGNKFKNDSGHGKFITTLCKEIGDKECIYINPSDFNITDVRASKVPNIIFKEKTDVFRPLFFEGTVSDKRVVFYKKITKKRLEEKGLSNKI